MSAHVYVLFLRGLLQRCVEAKLVYVNVMRAQSATMNMRLHEFAVALSARVGRFFLSLWV